MCTPAILTTATDDQLLQLISEGLGELTRRYRPIQQHRGFLARVEGGRHALEAMELEHAKLDTPSRELPAGNGLKSARGY
jgi:hypothetical protein